MTDATWRPLCIMGLVPLIMLFTKSWRWLLIQLALNLLYGLYFVWTLFSDLNPVINLSLYLVVYSIYIISLIDMVKKRIKSPRKRLN